MNRYFIRATKYLVRVIFIFVVVFTLMYLTGQSAISPDMLSEFFTSKETIIMMVVLLALVLVHPKLGYVKRSFDVDLSVNYDKVLNMFAVSGYSLECDDDEKMVFRATGSFNRFMLLGEDAIIIDKKAFPTTIEGNRKNVVRVMYRLKP